MCAHACVCGGGGGVCECICAHVCGCGGGGVCVCAHACVCVVVVVVVVVCVCARISYSDPMFFYKGTKDTLLDPFPIAVPCLTSNKTASQIQRRTKGLAPKCPLRLHIIRI